MKLSKILNEARKGKWLMTLNALDSSKIIANSKGTMTIANTIFCKKHVLREPGDEIVKVLNGAKEQNITEIYRTIKRLSESEIEIRFREDKSAYWGKIEIDC